jgi:DNA-directed RNA polymerase specialized sigma subunit
MGSTLRQKIAQLSPERQAKIKAMADAWIEEEMTLRDLRQALNLTQAEVAQQLGIGQEGVSRMEKRGDMLLSTLNQAVRAMGGELELVVKFPDRPSIKLLDLQDSL